MDRRVVLLDGGMGQELVWRSAKPPSPIWSAMVMLQQPELVRTVHREFIAAGARVITLNAFSATRARLERVGLEDRFQAFQRRAWQLAQEAREQSGVEGVRLAGCLPPLGGRPQEVSDVNGMRAAYEEIATLQAPHVDLFLCESFSSAQEARAAAQAACATGKPVWVSWKLGEAPDGKLAGGETLAQAAAALEGLAVEALLVNCAPPESVDAAQAELAALSRASGRVWGAYANGFTPLPPEGPESTPLDRREDLDPDVYAESALRWVEAGAVIVGGCCEVGPAHIAELARVLGEGGSQISGALR